MFRMISISCLISFQKLHQMFIDNYLKHSIDCFGKQLVVFLELVKIVNQNVISGFNGFSKRLLIQIACITDLNSNLPHNTQS